MSTPEPGFSFHRNGEISLGWRGDTFWIHLPTIDEFIEIEAYREELRSQSAIPVAETERVRNLVRDIEAADAAGDADTKNTLLKDRNEANADLMRSVIAEAQDKNIKALSKIIEMVGSDNWPPEPGGWPVTALSMTVVDQITTHWLSHLPLASSVPDQNGTQNPAKTPVL